MIDDFLEEDPECDCDGGLALAVRESGVTKAEFRR